MNRMSGNSGAVRFRDGADKYATYLDTREGRLRLDLSFANLREFLPQSSQPLLALDIGGGTGAMAVRLAQLGLEVRLLDTSLPMLDLAKHAVREAAVADRIELRHGDAAEFETLFPAGSFDVILCHNILEYVDDPFTVLRGVSRALRDQASIVSVLVRNQAGEVFKAAIRDRDLDAAEQNLGAAWADESLYGGKVRLFEIGSLRAMFTAASLAVTAERGVRVISDYLPETALGDEEYERIFEIERKLGQRPEFTAVARYTQFVARLASPPGPMVNR
jgi:S-adenosylmethionine-dependent methyltransferase